MVAAGLGCTLLPLLAVPRLAASGSGVEARPFECLGAHRQIGLLWRAAFPRGEDLMALGEFIQERLPPDIHRSQSARKPSAGNSLARARSRSHVA